MNPRDTGVSEQRCTGCGGAFACGRDTAACWCTELPALPRELLLAEGTCYCPACLKKLIESTRRLA